MRQEDLWAQEEDPVITAGAISRPEGFDLQSALMSIKKGDKKSAVNGFLYLAAGMRYKDEVEQALDRAGAELDARGAINEEWAQRIIEILKDTLTQTRERVRRVTSKPTSGRQDRRVKNQQKSGRSAGSGRKPEPPRKPEAERKPIVKSKAWLEAEQAKKETMPGVFREVTVTGEKGSKAQVELFFGHSKKGEPIVRVYAVKSGDAKILTPGATYQLHGLNMPTVLNQAILKAGIRASEVITEAARKRDELKPMEENDRKAA